MLKKSMPYAVELNGRLLQGDKGQLNTLSDLSNIKGNCRVVSDFQDAIARTMTVEADTRYVELMISRKLQEAGEFDQAVTVIAHWKKRRGKNTTDIFFTALPSKRYFRYLELVAEHGDHLVILPLQSILLTMLRKYGKSHSVAVVIQHERFADILIGSRKKVLYANRVVAFDNSDEQIQALWEAVRSDIDTFSHDQHQPINQVYVATWIDSGPLPQWTDDGAPELIPVQEHRLVMGRQQVKASLPGLIHETPARYAVASKKDKLFGAAKSVLPYFNIVLLLAALILGGYGMWHQHHSVQLASQIEKMRQVVMDIERKIPPKTDSLTYKPALAFIQSLWSCRNLPTYGQILDDVSKGIGGALRIENINANYTDEKVDVKAFGQSNATFEIAYKGYQALQRRLRKRGYTIVNERFDTQINASSFLIQFSKEM